MCDCVQPCAPEAVVVVVVVSMPAVVAVGPHQLPLSSPIMESRMRFQPSSSLYQVSLRLGL